MESRASMHLAKATAFWTAGASRLRGFFLPLVGAIAAVANDAAMAAEQARENVLPLPIRDLSAAEELADQIAALSARIKANEARRLAFSAYAAANELKRTYGVVWPPLFNNMLVNSGIKKRGLCFQWAEDLLVRLDALKLSSIELRWGEAYAGTWQESNCVVVTSRGGPFDTGIILDCWRHSGHLYWCRVSADKVHWVENRTYARFVRNHSAAADHHFAFQTRREGKQQPARLSTAKSNR